MAAAGTTHELPHAEKPLPASPPPGIVALESRPIIAQEHYYGAAPHLPATLSQAAVSPEEAEAISDRTPAQKALDEDIELNDAGPHIPLASHEIPSLNEEPILHQGSPIPQVDIAAPPSESDRQLPPAVLPGPAPIAEIIAREEWVQPTDRTWLLPPARSEHKSKKCLVLDLDETLVHASFKVSGVCRIEVYFTLILADATPS